MSKSIQPGDQVVCIESVTAQGGCTIIAGETYPVQAMRKTPCGCIVVDIGQRDPRSSPTGLVKVSCRCGKSYTEPYTQTQEWNIRRFKKIEELSQDETDMMLDRILEKQKA